MNYFKMVGTVLNDVRVMSSNVSRLRLMVTSNTGLNGKSKNDFFDFVAFGDTSVKLANEVKINDVIEIVGHISNSRFQKNGESVTKDDFVIDEFKKSIKTV